MENFAGYIATGIVSLLVGIALQRLKDRPKLLYWIPGSFLFQLKQQNVELRTDSLTIQNVGREPAKDLEIVHKQRPDHFQFSTAIAFTEETNPTGEHIIKIANLGANEHINLQLISFKAIPVLLAVRSATGQAQSIEVHLQRVIPRWLQVSAGAAMLLGAGFFLYWAGSAVVFLSRSLGLIQ